MSLKSNFKKIYLCTLIIIAIFVMNFVLSLFMMKSFAASYSLDYRYWNQRDSDDEWLRWNGCLVVAEAKLLYATGIERNAWFNPDVWYNWKNACGYGNGDWNSLVKYASNYGKNLTYMGTCNVDDSSLWININAGYHTILQLNNHLNDHWVLVDNDVSKANGAIYVDQSGAQYSNLPYGGNGPRLLSDLGYQRVCGYYFYYKPTIPTNVLNLGDNFYAYMLMSNHLELFNVDVDSQVVLQQGVHMDKKQIWNFVRQSDGSYVIKNVATGKYLDVLNSNDYDGGVIRTFSYNGSNAQKFFLYGTQDNCVIRPACSATRTISIDGGINSVGNKLNMWEYWGAETQLFNIWKVQEAKSAKLNYNANGSNVTLNWIKDKDTDQYDRYNMIIKSGTVGNVKEYKKIADVAGTSYCINLPAGYYEITLESWNYFSHAYSNVIKFTIKNTSGETQHTHDWNNGKVTKSATCTATGVKTYTCTECRETKTETIAKTAHNYKTTTKKATLSKQGSIVKKCSCGHIRLNTPIAYPKTIKLKTTSYTYNGKVRKPGVTVTDSKGKKISSSNYTITYSNKNSKKVGDYIVTIKFKGNYEGKKKLTYKINPKGVSLKKLTKGKKQFKVTWVKNTTQTTGYEVQYSTNKNFKSETKKVKIKKNKTTSTIIKKLKGKKKYYVRVRTYKNVGGNKICSGWSKVLNVKTK